MFWGIQNRAVRDRLLSEGVKGVKLPGELTMGTAIQRSGEAARRVGRSKIYDMSENEVRTIDPDEIEKVYDMGYQIVRIKGDQGYKPQPGVRNADKVDAVEFVLVKSNRVVDLPEQVMHKKRGYIPKVNQGIEFIVQERVVRNVGGRLKGTTITRGFASSRHQAELMRDNLRAKEGNALDKSSLTAQATSDTEDLLKGDKFIVLGSDEFDMTGRAEAGFFDAGGLFNSPRATHKILYNGETDLFPERVNVFDTYTRQIGHAANVISRNSWRLIQQEKWVKAAQANGHTEIKKFSDPIKGGNDDKVVRFLKRWQDEINHWTLVPTRDENLWEGAVQRIHDWAVYGENRIGKFWGAGDKKEFASVLKFKHKDPFAGLRTGAFHFTLGVFNPIQLWVQAQGAAVTYARYPKQAAAATRDMFRAGLLDFMDDKQALEVAEKMGGKEFRAAYQAWRDSGFRDSIFTTADHAMVEAGIGSSATSLSRMSSAVSRAGNIGLTFYKMGELANRRVAFFASLNRYVTDTGKTKIDPSDLAEIVKDARLSMLELSKANAAVWQGGPNRGFFENLVAVGLQFKQISAKTLELMGKNEAQGGFDLGTRIRIALGQMALYGTAGVPLGNYVFKEMQDMLGISADDMSPEVANVINQGAWGFFIVNGLGAEVDVSNRGSLVRGVQDFIYSTILADVPMYERMWGAAGAVGMRFFDAMRPLSRLVFSGAVLEEGITRDDFEIVFKGLLRVPSFGNSLFKARLMQKSDQILSKYGRLIAEDDYNLATELAVGLGFQPSDEVLNRALMLDKQSETQLIRETTDIILQEYATMNVLDDASMAQLQRRLKIIAHVLDNPALVNKVSENVHRHLSGQESSELGRRAADKLRDIAEGIADEYTVLHNRFGFGSFVDSQGPVSFEELKDKAEIR